MGDHLPVRPGVVRSAAHRFVILVAKLGIQRRAGELPVRELHGILLDVALHLLEVIRGYLVPASPGPAVDGDGDRPLFESEGFGGSPVEHPVHDVQLQEMVAGSEGPELGETPFQGFVAHQGAVGISHAAAFLGDFQVLFPSVYG